ncbi:hypothetical protein CROQUDRAFT_39717, partial [Cronartium quercuum f. sp. fusiforme G11]
LLERFVEHTTQAELPNEPTLKKVPQSSNVLRENPTAALKSLLFVIHNLMLAVYPLPPLACYDCYPKMAETDLALEKWVYQGHITLKVVCSPEAQMIKKILPNPFEKMIISTYQNWMAGLGVEYYQVVKIKEVEYNRCGGSKIN